MSAPLNISKGGAAFIRRWEGCELRAYQDVAGVWTIGAGHTRSFEDGRLQKRAATQITQEEAGALLAEDLAGAIAAVNRRVTRSLRQHEFDALVSFVFNVGEGAFAESTALRRLNGGKPGYFAMDAHAWWNKADLDGDGITEPHEVSDGLVNRRAAERKLFLVGDYAA